MQHPTLGPPALPAVDFDHGEPTHARSLLQAAERYACQGETSAALDAYRHAARIHTEQGFYRHAVAIYKNILALAPGDLDAHRNLGQLFTRLGLLSDASAQYEYVVRAAQIADQSIEALEALRHLVMLYPADARIQLRFVDLAFALGHRSEAVARLRSAAQLLKSSGRIDEFLRIGERLLREEPGDIVLARDLAKAYLVRGNGRYALARLKMCFDDAPRDVETLDLMAQAFELLGERERAVSLLKALAQIHEEQGRYAQSQDALHRALDINPADGELQRLLTQATRKRRISEIEIAIDFNRPNTLDGTGNLRAVKPEARTLEDHMPGCATSQELRAFDPPSRGVLDLFPIDEARRKVAKCLTCIDSTVAEVRSLITFLPVPLTARAMLERALEDLLPGSELVSELVLLRDSLARNDWINELVDLGPDGSERGPRAHRLRHGR